MPGEIKVIGKFLTVLGETGITPKSLERVTSDPEAMQAIKVCIDAQAKRLRQLKAAGHAEDMRVKHTYIRNIQQLTNVEYHGDDFDHFVGILSDQGMTRVRQLIATGPEMLRTFGLTDYELDFIEESLRAIAHPKE